MSKKELKTLKDLSSVSVNHTNHTKQKVVGIDDDGDLIFNAPPERSTENLNFVSHELLREEAEKWIEKLTKEHHELHDGYETTLERDFKNEYAGCSIIDDGCICDICHTLRFITMFFNLKKEEKTKT